MANVLLLTLSLLLLLSSFFSPPLTGVIFDITLANDLIALTLQI